MNRPLLPAEPVAWEEPHITSGGHRLHRPEVFIAWVLPLTNRIYGSRLIPAPRKRARKS